MLITPGVNLMKLAAVIFSVCSTCHRQKKPRQQAPEHLPPRLCSSKTAFYKEPTIILATLPP